MEYQLIRSYRKSLSVEILYDGSILVRAPFWITEKRIVSFLEKKRSWIEKQQKKAKFQPEPIYISDEFKKKLRESTRETIVPLVESWSKKTGLSYSGISITSAKKRFGSCNGKNHLNFSLYLSLYSQDAVEYVVLHELCHTAEHNHSRAFYDLLYSYMPDYKEREKKLKEQAKLILTESS